jgi:hypothetical protein
MRRGRQARLRAGTLLPWTTPPFGYRLDPDRPRQASAVRVDPAEAALVAQLFDWYLEPQATIYRLAARLTDLGVPTPRGGPRWNVASVRGILRNPAYAGRALTNRTQVAPARQRKSAMLPAGPGASHAPRPKQDWIAGGPGCGNGIIQRLAVPALWAKEPPVGRAGGMLVHQVHADPDLAVADLAQRPRVLPGHARGRGPVLGEPGVIHHEGLDRWLAAKCRATFRRTAA